MHERGELPRGGRRRRGRQALHQVDRQGPAQGHVQDGHLDLPVLLRRADLRRRRPVARDFVDRVLLRHRDDDRGRRPGRDRRGDGAPPSRRLRRCAGLPHTRSTSAASTPTACAARTMSGRRTRCATLQHAVRAQRAGHATATTRALRERAGRASFQTIRGLFRIKDAEETAAQPVPLDEVEPAADDRQALLDRRDVVRLDLARGARDARASP